MVGHCFLISDNCSIRGAVGKLAHHTMHWSCSSLSGSIRKRTEHWKNSHTQVISTWFGAVRLHCALTRECVVRSFLLTADWVWNSTKCWRGDDDFGNCLREALLCIGGNWCISNHAAWGQAHVPFILLSGFFGAWQKDVLSYQCATLEPCALFEIGFSTPVFRSSSLWSILGICFSRRRELRCGCFIEPLRNQSLIQQASEWSTVKWKSWLQLNLKE